MDVETLILELISGNLVLLLVAAVFIVVVVKGVKIVPQSEKYVIERFGKLRSVLGPGINLIVPFFDRVAHEISILERQLPNASQDAITAVGLLLVLVSAPFLLGLWLAAFDVFRRDDVAEHAVEAKHQGRRRGSLEICQPVAGQFVQAHLDLQGCLFLL